MPFRKSTHLFKGPFTLGEIADELGVEIKDESRSRLIKSLAALNAAGGDDISFFDNPRYLEQFKVCSAAACIVNAKFADQAPEGVITLVSTDAYRDYAKVARMFHEPIIEEPRIHPTAIIHETAVIGENCSIGAHTFIGRDVEIGDNTRISDNVTINAALIGKNCVILSGARIGQDGFGYAMGKEGHLKVPQLGGVVIGNDVEIGANTTIDRGSGPNTSIGEGTKIDNLVQIAHNVEIGKFCVIVAQAGIAGSTKIGDYCVMGGQSGVSGHLNIGTAVKISAGAGVIRNVPSGVSVGGYPAVNIRDWHKQTIALERISKNKNKKEN